MIRVIQEAVNGSVSGVVALQEEGGHGGDEGPQHGVPRAEMDRERHKLCRSPVRPAVRHEGVDLLHVLRKIIQRLCRATLLNWSQLLRIGGFLGEGVAGLLQQGRHLRGRITGARQLKETPFFMAECMAAPLCLEAWSPSQAAKRPRRASRRIRRRPPGASPSCSACLLATASRCWWEAPCRCVASGLPGCVH